MVGVCVAPNTSDSEPARVEGPSNPAVSQDAGADARTELAAPVVGLHAEYFDGYYDRRVDRIEANIDHDWKLTSPAEGVGSDRFSARWTGKLTPIVTAKTTITIDADDGTRVWIDDKLLIDDWNFHFVERRSAEVELTRDVPVSIRVDYFEADLDASIRLSWAAGDKLAEQIIPQDRFSRRWERQVFPRSHRSRIPSFRSIVRTRASSVRATRFMSLVPVRRCRFGTCQRV